MYDCPTCGLSIRSVKAEIHADACRHWRQAIDDRLGHDIISRLWAAASGCR